MIRGNNFFRALAPAVFAIALAAAFAGCSSDSAGGKGCKSDRDCAGVGSNSICNLQSQVCVDKGHCSTSQQCALFYPDMLVPFCNAGSGACEEKGPCVASTVCPIDGQVCDVKTGACKKASGSDGDETETEDPVADGDENAVEQELEEFGYCVNVAGNYDVTVNCDGTNANGTATIIQPSDDCNVIIYVNAGSFSVVLKGRVDETGAINTVKDKKCSGGVAAGGLNLTCEGGCSFAGGKTPTSGEINVDPTEIDFGSVTSGEPTTSKKVTIMNLGQGALTISNIVIDPSSHPDFGFKLPDGVTLPKVLAYGEALLFDATLTATDNTRKRGNMLIINSSQTAQVIVPMKSDPKGVCMLELLPNDVSPPELNLGRAPYGAVNAKAFYVKNVGEADCLLINFSLTDSANNAFEIDPLSMGVIQPAPNYFTLGVKQSVTVNVFFHPFAGVHQMGVIQGAAKVDYTNPQAQGESSVSMILLGEVSEPAPKCLNVDPLDGLDTLFPWGNCNQGCPGIKFGMTELRSTTPRQLILTNCGDEDVTVGFPPNLNGIETGALPMTCWLMPPCPPEFLFNPGLPLAQTVIPRGGTFTLDVTFSPTVESQIQSWTLNIWSDAIKSEVPFIQNAWNNPNSGWPPGYVSFGISGTGAKRGIDVLPSKVDFGLITLGCCSRAQTITIYDTGELQMDITAIRLSPGSNHGFELVNVPPLPTTVPGGGTARFGVRYCAPDAGPEGPAYGTVEIVSQAGTFTVPLSAEATIISHQVDKFHQNDKPTVDILFVVDCSGSMSDDQDNMARNFDSFINFAISWNADIQIGITAADDAGDSSCRGCSQGNLKGDPKVLKYGGANSMNLNDVKSLFKSHVKLGSSCSGNEKGLEPAHLALSNPLINDPNGNAGFLRDNASLVILFVSDEEDQSTSDTSYYIDFFKNIKGFRNLEMLQIYAVIFDCPRGCSSSSQGSETPGCRYQDVAANCGGFTRSICDTDWSEVYRDIANRSFGLRTQFFLSREADPNTLVVTVNGRRMTEGNDYVYDSDSNSIVFNTPPAAGSDIVAEYDALCRRH